MTILPKKKVSKEKSDAENQELPLGHNHSVHGHHPSATDPRHERHARSRTSPPLWHATQARDDKMTPCDPGGGFEASHDASANHNKRRHRSSPHRNVRKHRGQGHPSVKGSVGGASVPLPSPPDYEEAEHEYNSEDEHQGPPESCGTDFAELERVFEQTLKEKKGFLLKKMGDDGACLFRAVADQVYGDQDMHNIVRKHCVDYMAKNRDYFQHYVTEDFATYLNRKRMDSCHGNHVEMQAMCEIYNRPIEVYQYSIDPINTFHCSYKTDNEPIRISYHRNVHYNSVVDPYKPTIGVGLGLPGLQPGLADKNLLRDAVQLSEDTHLEKTMLQDKLRETDWEVTQETIEEQVARESYLQWLRDQEKRAKRQGSNPRSASATCSSASEHSQLVENVGSPDVRVGGRSPRNRSSQNSAQNSPHCMESDPSPGSPRGTEVLPLPVSVLPQRSPQGSPVLGAVGGSLSPQGATEVRGDFKETASIMNHLPASMYAFADWGEDDILAQVMAQSQQEYLDSLKKNAANCAGIHNSSNYSNDGDTPMSPNVYGPSTSTSSQGWCENS